MEKNRINKIYFCYARRVHKSISDIMSLEVKKCKQYTIQKLVSSQE